MALKFLQHAEIDREAWDRCISDALNSSVYAASWYLDIVAPDWNALVEDNYLAVMPLPTRKRWGIQYLFLPPFCQQLGIFGSTRLDPPKVEEFLTAIPESYQWIDLNLNQYNSCLRNDWIARVSRNYLLDLIPPYEKIQSGYSKNTRKNLKIAGKQKLDFSQGLNTREFIDFYQQNIGSLIDLPKENLHILQQLITQGQRYGIAQLFGVFDDHNSLIACALIMRFQQRSILLASASNEEGREKSAMYYLLDRYFYLNAESEMIFDFEGSNIESIAYFFAGFGAQATDYQRIKINRLPFYLRWMK